MKAKRKLQASATDDQSCTPQVMAPALAADGSTELAKVPEAARGLTLDDAGRAALEHLRPLLALPAGALLQRLLDDGPDGGPQWWASYPSLAAYLP